MSLPPPTSTLFPYTTLFRSSLLRELQITYKNPLSLAFTPDGREVWVACEGERRSEEHTSELQSRFDIVCRLLLEKKKISSYYCYHYTRNRDFRSLRHIYEVS